MRVKAIILCSLKCPRGILKGRIRMNFYIHVTFKYICPNRPVVMAALRYESYRMSPYQRNEQYVLNYMVTKLNAGLRSN